MEDNNGSNWFTILLIIIVIWLAFFHKQKYEGQTAEEWFNYYDYAEARNAELRGCIEDYGYSDDYEDLQNIVYNCL